MFDPKSDGQIIVDTTSGLAGGHELLVREYDAVNDLVWVDNSSGLSWAVNGRGYFQGADLRKLLSDGGDVTVLTFATTPVPTPPPSPTPAPDSRLVQAAALVHQADALMQELAHDNHLTGA
ncbi:hypothetical protein ACWGQ5_38540 [Streptomyces sp. NPDC055722]